MTYSKDFAETIPRALLIHKQSRTPLLKLSSSSSPRVSRSDSPARTRSGLTSSIFFQSIRPSTRSVSTGSVSPIPSDVLLLARSTTWCGHYEEWSAATSKLISTTTQVAPLQTPIALSKPVPLTLTPQFSALASETESPLSGASWLA